MDLTTLFVDLNSYFASVEQQLRPELRGRPVAVVPLMSDSTCCIAASVEAKRFGVRTGTNVGEARRMCPELALVQARTREYVEAHHAVLAAVDTVLPVGGTHSIDEFSCKLLGAQKRREEAERLAHGVKRAIRERVGACVTCSIGIAPNRFLAKVASNMVKPDGLVVIEQADLPLALLPLELRDLPGIGRKMEERLRRHGITSIDRLLELSELEMAGVWGGVTGRVFHQWLRGVNVPETAERKSSIGHQHVLAPELRVGDAARPVIIRLLHKAAARLRHDGYWVRRLALHIRTVDRQDWDDAAAFPETQDTLTLLEALLPMWERRPRRAPLLRIGVTLFDLVPGREATLPIFTGAQRRGRLAGAMDKINKSFGHGSIYFGGMHGARSAAPMRIAFRSIPSLDIPDNHSEDARTDERNPEGRWASSRSR